MILTPGLTAATPASDRWVGHWLMVMVGLVFVMVIVGGLTRLTDSGLSITEWAPVTGVIPPLTEAAWQVELEKYRQIPEYQLQNRGMSMAEFQFIYWWEWGHRFLGRLIGLAFAVPLAVFLVRGWIRPHLRLRLFGLFLLGGFQGFIGWWMVASGLTERLDVSQYRLATHLGMAFILLGALWWTAQDAYAGAERPRYAGRPLVWAGAAISAAVFVQILLGALVAGLDAGRIWTDWPLMDGRFVPVGYGELSPVWLNAFENRAAVQFNHRIGAYLLAGLGAWFAWAVWKDGAARGPAQAFVVTLAGQVGLGVATLMAAAPLGLSALHQATAAALLIFALAATRAAALTAGSASPALRSPAASRNPAPAE